MINDIVATVTREAYKEYRVTCSTNPHPREYKSKNEAQADVAGCASARCHDTAVKVRDVRVEYAHGEWRAATRGEILS